MIFPVHLTGDDQNTIINSRKSRSAVQKYGTLFGFALNDLLYQSASAPDFCSCEREPSEIYLLELCESYISQDFGPAA